MSFAEAQAYLEALGVDAMKSVAPSLERIDAICDALDRPERAAPAIHVTGTNGKTSTARIASSLLHATGLSVATYTSPHLQSVTERLAIGGEPISETDFGDTFDQLLPIVGLVEQRMGERLTYFEILTAMFFAWAAESAANAMVVEVGLGGRWDATNVVDAPVAVITNIGLEHTDLLGTDRAGIAREKSGIIKQGSVVVTAERTPDMLDVIGDAAGAMGATRSTLGRDFSARENRVAFGGRYLSLETAVSDYEGLFLPLHGAHQGVNAATALEAVTRYLPAQVLDHEVVAEGLAATLVPGRIEAIRSDKEGGAPVVLDVAHNPDGMSTLVSSLTEAFAFERAIVVVGMLADKSHRDVLAEIARLDAVVIATAPKSERAASVDHLKRVADDLSLACETIDDVTKAVDFAIDTAGSRELIVVTGSHYVVGEARSHLLAGSTP